jgi:hypothetical protein
VDFKDLSVFAHKSSNIGPIGLKIGTYVFGEVLLGMGSCRLSAEKIQLKKLKKRHFTWVNFKEPSVFAHNSLNIGPIGLKIGT